jgi:hypothetical protein
MPTIYRIMGEEGGKPKVGSRFGELGAGPKKTSLFTKAASCGRGKGACRLVLHCGIFL